MNRATDWNKNKKESTATKTVASKSFFLVQSSAHISIFILMIFPFHSFNLLISLKAVGCSCCHCLVRPVCISCPFSKIQPSKRWWRPRVVDIRFIFIWWIHRQETWTVDTPSTTAVSIDLRQRLGKKKRQNKMSKKRKKGRTLMTLHDRLLSGATCSNASARYILLLSTIWCRTHGRKTTARPFVLFCFSSYNRRDKQKGPLEKNTNKNTQPNLESIESETRGEKMKSIR